MQGGWNIQTFSFANDLHEMFMGMSFYRVVVSQVPFSPATYGLAWLGNAVIALLLNFFVAGPLARFFFGKL
ncbi:hypothetical protein BU202_01625 [Streptococcus cuniculi]|uniref:DUF2798 domain-containing protein n=1 Tax=Streptococcus cuniculi TaxID=1432788 RepID=A0A1Q8EB26_9STRE|nr:hypothetical protein BU202_01625 [Streptococcus cuniculi]